MVVMHSTIQFIALAIRIPIWHMICWLVDAVQCQHCHPHHPLHHCNRCLPLRANTSNFDIYSTFLAKVSQIVNQIANPFPMPLVLVSVQIDSQSHIRSWDQLLARLCSSSTSLVWVPLPQALPLPLPLPLHPQHPGSGHNILAYYIAIYPSDWQFPHKLTIH